MVYIVLTNKVTEFPVFEQRFAYGYCALLSIAVRFVDHAPESFNHMRVCVHIYSTVIHMPQENELSKLEG